MKIGNSFLFQRWDKVFAIVLRISSAVRNTSHIYHPIDAILLKKLDKGGDFMGRMANGITDQTVSLIIAIVLGIDFFENKQFLPAVFLNQFQLNRFISGILIDF